MCLKREKSGSLATVTTPLMFFEEEGKLNNKIKEQGVLFFGDMSGYGSATISLKQVRWGSSPGGGRIVTKNPSDQIYIISTWPTRREPPPPGHSFAVSSPF